MNRNLPIFDIHYRGASAGVGFARAFVINGNSLLSVACEQLARVARPVERSRIKKATTLVWFSIALFVVRLACGFSCLNAPI